MARPHSKLWEGVWDMRGHRAVCRPGPWSVYQSQHSIQSHDIGVGSGPVGLVLTGPFLVQIHYIHYYYKVINSVPPMFVGTPMQFLAIARASNNKRDRVALFINNLTRMH